MNKTKSFIAIICLILLSRVAIGVQSVGCVSGNCINGQGTYTWPDGEKYVGEWKDDKKHGHGTLTSSNGKKVIGEWENGILVRKLSNAACSKSNLDALQADSRAFLEELKKELPEIDEGAAPKPVSYSIRTPAPTGDRFYKIDRSDKFLSQLDSVGVVTFDKLRADTPGYGSGVLINECYVLTNRHVVEGLSNLYQSKNPSVKFGIGQTQHFSFGQKNSCNDPGTFSNQSVKAKVIDYGANDTDNEEDWAILKLEKPAPSSVRPARLSRILPHKNEIIYKAGYPYQELADDFKLEALRANIEGVSRADSNVAISFNKNDLDGLSGGGVFIANTDEKTDKPVLELVGIHRGTATSITVKGILDRMKTNGRHTIEEISRPKRPGTCD